MRFTFSLGVIITVAAWSCFCRAQACDSGLYDQEYQCAYNGSCHSFVDVFYPNGENGDEQIVCDLSFPCCGQLFTSCRVLGYCYAAKKAGMSAAVRKYLEKLPFDSQLLVADCNGHYAPLKPGSPRPSKPETFAILDDRVLR
jgi:hypothetical protein